MSLPYGASVREKATGNLGKVVRIPHTMAMRGCAAVLFNDGTPPRLIALAGLDYVAKRYDTAREWHRGC